MYSQKRIEPPKGIIYRGFCLVLYNVALQCKPLSKSNVWALSIMFIVDKQMQDYF